MRIIRPHRGPKRKPRSARSPPKHGIWRFTYLAVTVEGGAEIIDLLSVQPLAERDF